MTTSGAVEAGCILRRLRVRRGYSWADEARALRDLAHVLDVRLPAALSSIQRSIARWESAAVSPSDRYQRLLAYLYAGDDRLELFTAFRHLGVTESRLRELNEQRTVDFEEFLRACVERLSTIPPETWRTADTALLEDVGHVLGDVRRTVACELLTRGRVTRGASMLPRRALPSTTR